MKLTLLYFNPIIGPEIFFSYPGSISEKISKKMLGFFDLDMSDSFFEVSLIEEDLKLTNLYFEITSCWARGSKEMLMLSVITEKKYKSELFYDALKEYSLKIMAVVNIYKAFYTRGLLKEEDSEIDLKMQELHTLLIECYNHLGNRLKDNIENEKIIKKFKKFEW
ncbi:MAG: hypothetical protein JSV23_05155 [Promethearchaeota archaeon]|nr:MAG: hypothetical protein JSV23_05155 [Candidatus Lokiarchaeota archaeon]